MHVIKDTNGSLTTSKNYSKPGGPFKELREHNHPQDPATKEFKVNVRRMIVDGCFSGAPLRRVISLAMAQFSEEGIVSAPKNINCVYYQTHYSL